MNTKATLNEIRNDIIESNKIIIKRKENKLNDLFKAIDTIHAHKTELKEMGLSNKNAINQIKKLGVPLEKTDTELKNAIKIALKLEPYGDYTIRKEEFSSMSKIANLLNFKPVLVNELMAYEGESYIDAVNDLLKTARVEFTGKRYSSKLAKSL